MWSYGFLGRYNYGHTTSECRNLDQELERIIQKSRRASGLVGDRPRRSKKRPRREYSWRQDKRASGRERTHRNQDQNPTRQEQQSPQLRGFIQMISGGPTDKDSN
ncbi:hypothetical protein F511_46954 [Dorcoceras hygrometricum]|uniref:Uncharacterized protein n=1 Tax=Dorcoceras hygrometricum TaxID=472368 RepID=A0A2Z6ZTA7_9LAMI|nr:hypothetical protein F511_46954 [Dorcoceras hygrometricum]